MSATRRLLTLALLVTTCSACNQKPGDFGPQRPATWGDYPVTNDAQRVTRRFTDSGAEVWFGTHPDLSGTDSAPSRPTREQWDAISKSVTGLNTKVTSIADLVDLSHLAGLDELVIKGENLDDEMLSYFPALAELRTLSILPNDSFTGSGLRYLATCPKLAELEIIFSEGLRGEFLSQLSQVPSLRRLVIIRGPITDTTIRQIGNLQQLTSLKLGDWGNSDNVQCKSVEPLTRLSALERIQLHGFDQKFVARLRVALPDCEVRD